MELKKEIDDGALGDIYHTRAWMLRRCWAGISPTFAHRELSGGGALIDIGVHVLDLALWLIRSRVLQNLRVEHAQSHLPGNDVDIEEAAAEVRYAERAPLRTLLRERLGTVYVISVQSYADVAVGR